MYYIGIDLGGTNIAVGIVDAEGKIVAKKSVPTNAHRPADEIIKDMAETAISLVNEFGCGMDEIKSIGVGSPGSVNKENGMIIYANNLNFKNTGIREGIQKYIDKPVYVDNDANVAAWAEATAGAAKGASDMIMITLGTGVGGGIVVNGKLYSGFNYTGGELGHVVIEAKGVPCSCGRVGCWEAYSSATALIRMTKEAAEADKSSKMWDVYEKEGKFSGRTAFLAAKEGDKTAQGVVDTYVEYLAVGIVNMVNIFQPEFLVVGGGVANEGENLLAPVRAIVEKAAYGNEGDVPATKIVKAFLGNDAGIIGAALLTE